MKLNELAVILGIIASAIFIAQWAKERKGCGCGQ